MITLTSQLSGIGLYLSMRLDDKLYLELVEKPDAIHTVDLHYILIRISLATTCL